MCKDALICLMTGSVYNRQKDARILFDLILRGDLDDQLWFFLKLAAYERNIATSTFVDEQDGYKTYTLTELKHKIMVEFGKKHFCQNKLRDEVNTARYARILFLIG